jgi:hypothetical protein
MSKKMDLNELAIAVGGTLVTAGPKKDARVEIVRNAVQESLYKAINESEWKIISGTAVGYIGIDAEGNVDFEVNAALTPFENQASVRLMKIEVKNIRDFTKYVNLLGQIKPPQRPAFFPASKKKVRKHK